MKICSVQDCDRKHFGRGYCQAHYTRMIRGQDVTAPLPYRKPRYPKNGGKPAKTPAERFADKVDKSAKDGHWLWTGAKDHKGYGYTLNAKRHRTQAHRAMWEFERGPIPEGYEIDHLCHTPSCVNPDHLRACTPAENQQNRKGANRNNGSGYRNVRWHKRDKRWIVTLDAYGKTHNGGRFESVEDANLAAIKLRESVLKGIPTLPQ